MPEWLIVLAVWITLPYAAMFLARLLGDGHDGTTTYYAHGQQVSAREYHAMTDTSWGQR